VVFGGSYHSGFNFGFNVAEAINYASVDWLRQVIDVKSCQCSHHSVKVSVYEIYKNLQHDPSVNRTKQFLAFQEFIFRKAEEEDS
jgi:[histone H3]-trimethyl-L-lysine9/36 demethylase